MLNAWAVSNFNAATTKILSNLCVNEMLVHPLFTLEVSHLGTDIQIREITYLDINAWLTRATAHIFNVNHFGFLHLSKVNDKFISTFRHSEIRLTSN